MRIVPAALAMVCVFVTRGSAQRDRAPGRDGIATFNHALEAATRSMAPAATMALWDDDGVSLLPSTRPIVGKPAIAEFLANVMKSLTGARMGHFSLWCYDIEISGRSASEWCTEHQVVSFADGKPSFDGWGRMLLLLHRSPDGGWRLKREMWNQAVPDDSLPPPRRYNAVN